MTKNVDLDIYVNSRYGIRFNSLSEFSLPDCSVGKNINIFEVVMSSSVHVDNKKKDILILSLGLTQRLDDTKLTVEAQYSINFSRSNVKFCLSLIMIGATVFYLSVLQKYMNLKQKILQ